MQFKVISDLHVDINSKYYSKFKFDPNAYYLIAGDISGSRHKTTKFLKQQNFKNCYFVEGNHMGYDLEWENSDHTKEACYVHLAEHFPLESNICFMDNDFKEIPDENIIIVGCTLYTDYNCFDNQSLGMRVGATYLNDFRYVRTYSNLGGDRLITPEDYLKRHETSLQFISEVCEKYSNHKIVVLTHHGPSKQSLSPEYVNDILSSSYVSDLEPFILKHTNIKLWVHGHVHRPFNYKIGECKVVAEPFGYRNENGMKLTKFIGKEVEV